MTAFSKKYYRDLTPLLKATDHPRPLDWPAVFGRQAPLELEIGFGNGEFLHRTSLEQPEHDFVGAEVAWASLKRALRRLARPPRPNVRVVLMKGEAVLARCFAPESLDVVRALFPIPWPDERQEKRRLFQREFLDLAASRLKADGRFILVTDSPELAEWTMAQAENSALNFALAERPAEMDTKYERKWQGGGQRTFFHLTGAKRHPIEVPAPLEIEMQAYYRDSFNPVNFTPEGCSGEVVVKFREFVFDQARQEGLLRAFVVEGPLTQDFFIRLKKEDARWKISPAIGTQLFPTKGVARALELVAAAGS
ncbi:hypothetical protein LJB86_00425 [Deltaproteobacteria bacterium OttesenSCG-928-M10]|nr:hypothetical protein [Deltaproteobacteria bacterium OttesenSCG-928-M10]